MPEQDKNVTLEEVEVKETKENVVSKKTSKEKEGKKNRLAEVFVKNYKYEGLILLVLALIAIVLGALIVNGTLTINDSVYLISDYPKPFAWILIVLGAASLVLAVWPFYKPSVSEIKRVSWPSKKTMVGNTITVFIFTIIFCLFFLLVDSLLTLFTNWLATLA